MARRGKGRGKEKAKAGLNFAFVLSSREREEDGANYSAEMHSAINFLFRRRSHLNSCRNSQDTANKNTGDFLVYLIS